MMATASLRARVLQAALGGWAPFALAACAEGAGATSTSPESPAGTATTTSTATTTAAPTPVTSGSPTPAPNSSALAQCPGQTERTCFEPFGNMNQSEGRRRPGTSASAPAHTFDANGCAPLAEVANGCCNPAMTGPAFEGGKCCYQFCSGSCCGRPLLVGGAPRLAEAVRVGDALGAGFDGPRDGDARGGAIAKAWLDDALLEHASIASFARFTLELLAVGAPSELVAAATRAMEDESRHAALCFDLAAGFGGGAHRAGPLPLDGVTLSSSLGDVVARAIVEGCIGETLAAALAHEQRAVAAAGPARAALAMIAEDETRHAELAWRFVAWAIARQPAMIELAAAAFDEGFARLPAPSPRPAEIDPATWAAAGRLEEATAREVAITTLLQVIEPARAALTRRTTTARQERLSHAST